MKLFFSLLLATAVSFTTLAQETNAPNRAEYTIKKDVILKDKVPYAKISGESSLFKDTDLLISSLTDVPLFTIKRWKYPTGNPDYSDLDGVKIEFKGSGKSLIRSGLPYGKAKLIPEIFRFWSDLVANNTIDPKTEADYISKFDNVEVVLAGMYEKTESEFLKGLVPIARDTTAEVEVKQISEIKQNNGSITQEVEIYQGGVYLMSMKKLWTQTWVMSFYRKVDTAMEVNDTATKKIRIATLTIPNFVLSMGRGSADLFTNMDLKAQKFEIKSLKEAEKQVVKYLTWKKLL